MNGLQKIDQELGSAQNAIVPIGTCQEKVCPRCKLSKEKTEFHKSKQSKDGLYSYCKDCNKKKRANWYVKNSDIVSKKAKIYRSENNEEVTKKYREQYQKNIDNCRLSARKSWNKNKENRNKKRREELQNNQEVREAVYLKNKEWSDKNKEQIKSRRKKYYEKNKDRIKERTKEKHSLYSKEQRMTINARARRWYNKNKETQAEKLRNKRNNNITKKLSNNISTSIRHSLRGNKAGRCWEPLVGYTIYDIKDHLEKQFTEGMDWNCFLRGEIHIDHKLPIAIFNFDSPDDEGFKQAWSLKNLQPLWAKDNLSKQDKILYPELLEEFALCIGDM